MRTSDRVLAAIVAGILILVVVVLVMERNAPAETYREGTTPMDVAHNYLFALQTADYQRAYAELSPQLRGYPDDLQEFVRQVRSQSYNFPLEEDVALSVLSAEIVDEWATVEVSESRFYNGGPFSSNRYSTTFELELELVEGNWKIAGGHSFFYYCWSERICR